MQRKRAERQRKRKRKDERGRGRYDRRCHGYVPELFGVGTLTCSLVLLAPGRGQWGGGGMWGLGCCSACGVGKVGRGSGERKKRGERVVVRRSSALHGSSNRRAYTHTTCLTHTCLWCWLPLPLPSAPRLLPSVPSLPSPPLPLPTDRPPPPSSGLSPRPPPLRTPSWLPHSRHARNSDPPAS